jgi:hypothetical protein
MKYKVRHMNQGQLGSLFGVTSHVVGKWLVEIGLRDEKSKKPTAEAHHGGYVVQVWSGGNYAWEWEPQKTVAALRRAGHQLVLDLPLDLVEPPALRGPFSISDDDARDILDVDGCVAVTTTSGTNTALVLRMLDAAYRTGTIERWLQAGSR